MTKTGYERHKDRTRAKAVALSRAGREIGDIPPVANSPRKAAARASFRSFCEGYFPKRFSLAWSPDHLKVISKIEQAVLYGGLFAVAMPRGAGKTTLCECAVLWAMLTGASSFVFLIGNCEERALATLANLKAELMQNEGLLEDFPEAVYPIHRLENESRRCVGQLHHGQRTHITWTDAAIVLPTIPGSRASAAIVNVAGLTGNVRGPVHTRPDGRQVRPSLVILDDPQTDQSARSLSQCAGRERILAGAVLGLAGPGKKISGIMPCTVIRPGDLADRILDPKAHPEWNGERTKLIYALPKNEKWWGRYAEVRGESLRMHGDIRLATDLYRAEQPVADEGAIVAWPERFKPDEASAIQNAMNLKLQDEAAFFAEYQNDPLPERGVEEEGMLTADEIAQKVNGLKRGLVPLAASRLTAFIDVQGKLLFWVVCAWQDDFTGHVVEYGAYPEQKRSYFTLRDAQLTLQGAAPGAGLEGAIYAGLEAVAKNLLGREWKREDGAVMRIAACLVDANWGTSTNIVYQYCRESLHSAVLMPSHGRFVGAASRPFREYTKHPGDQLGLNWYIPAVRSGRVIRHALFDANFWKSFVQARLAVRIGDKGCLSLFGRDPEGHRLFAEHLAAEYRVKTQGRGRVVDEWKLRPETGGENHWLDGVVGCAVAASIQGAILPGTDAPKKPKKYIKLSELKAQARGRRSDFEREAIEKGWI